MKRSFLTPILLTFCCFPLLCGCEMEDQKFYPTLHSVPDRPKQDATSPSEVDANTMDHDYQEKMKRNKELRRAFGLE